MLQTDLYQKDHKKLATDMLMGMLAATDTSRNTTITALCYFNKNLKAKEQLRAHIDEYMQSKNITDVFQIGH